MTQELPKTNAETSFTVNAAASAWLATGRKIAEATVIETWGSAPVPVGGRMVIASEDEFQGSVSGGCVEADVIVASLDVIADGRPQTMNFGIADETAWRAGLPCGCKIRVLVRPMTGDATSVAHHEVQQDRRPRVVATRITDGAQKLYDVEDNSSADIAEVLKSGTSRVVNGEDGETFLHAIIPAPRIVIVGATHVAQVLSQIAKATDYDVVIIDPRSAFTSAMRFDPTTAITGWPESEMRTYASDHFTAIVTLTHVGQIDEEALKIAIASPCRYVGALGSRKTHAARTARLQKAGFSDGEIGRIRAPIGLNIGGRTPGEIAVSILAEIVATFHGKLEA